MVLLGKSGKQIDVGCNRIMSLAWLIDSRSLQHPEPMNSKSE